MIPVVTLFVVCEEAVLLATFIIPVGLHADW